MLIKPVHLCFLFVSANAFSALIYSTCPCCGFVSTLPSRGVKENNVCSHRSCFTSACVRQKSFEGFCIPEMWRFCHGFDESLCSVVPSNLFCVCDFSLPFSSLDASTDSKYTFVFSVKLRWRALQACLTTGSNWLFGDIRPLLTHLVGQKEMLLSAQGPRYYTASALLCLVTALKEGNFLHTQLARFRNTQGFHCLSIASVHPQDFVLDSDKDVFKYFLLFCALDHLALSVQFCSLKSSLI